MSKWIKCSRRFPIQGARVLIMDENGELSVAFRESWGWRLTNTYIVNSVLDRKLTPHASIIAWTPLPKVPEVNGNDNI